MAGTAFLGGAFDPVHRGHLRLAHAVKERLNLESVEFIPNAAPPHKHGSHLPYETRVALLKLALENEPYLHVNTLERDNSHPHYTYETLRLLREEKGPDTPLFFVIGLDSLLALDTWYHGLELTSLAHLVVLGRPGYSLDDASETMRDYLKDRLIFSHEGEFDKALATPAGHCLYVEGEAEDVSSSELRARILNYYASKDSAALDYLHTHLPEEVCATILSSHLYANDLL